MSAETLTIALVVLVGATILGMVKQFFADPWDTQEGAVYVEHRVYQPATVPVPQTQIPVPQPQPVPVAAAVVEELPALPAPRPKRAPAPAPRREPVPELALLAAD